MNWITTNIRLPEDVYMNLKMTAAKQRKSVAAIVREKLGVETNDTVTQKDLWLKLDKFASRMAKKNHGVSLSKKLIKMRYEQ